LVSGFWHGANWTFIFWGLLNAIYVMPSVIFKTNRNNLDVVASGRFLPTFNEFISIGFTFLLNVFAWIFFRSASISDAFIFIINIFSKSLFSVPRFVGMVNALVIFFLILLFMIIEWFGREKKYAIQNLQFNFSRPVRWAIYISIIFLIGMFMHTSETPFIYFQF